MLVLTRKVGSVIYGGKRLGSNIEATCDHKFTVSKIVDNLRERYAVILVEYGEGAMETHRLDASSDDFFVDGIRVALIAINVVDRGSHLIARIGIDAPSDYRIVRDNANKKVA